MNGPPDPVGNVTKLRVGDENGPLVDVGVVVNVGEEAKTFVVKSVELEMLENNRLLSMRLLSL